MFPSIDTSPKESYTKSIKWSKLNWREVFQEVIKCETNDDYTEEDVGICADNAFLNFWHVCLGDTCGATLPEGVCADECIPALEEEVAKCDGLIELFIVNFGKQIII